MELRGHSIHGGVIASALPAVAAPGGAGVQPELTEYQLAVIPGALRAAEAYITAALPGRHAGLSQADATRENSDPDTRVPDLV